MNSDYGILLREKDIKLHRKYFKEMVKLVGIIVKYRACRPDKHWTTYAEIDSNYAEPIPVGCIFNEHLDQKTMKKLGWVTELDSQASIISVPYDLPALQVGALFVVPSGLDCAKGRLFRVTEISNIAIYPASVTCVIVPEYEDTFSNADYTYEHSSMNILTRTEDEDKL